MPRILSNTDVEKILSMDVCLEAMEELVRDFAEGEAVNGPRVDLLVRGEEADSFHVFKTMTGCFPARGVTALRIASDVLHWLERDGVLRKEKKPVAPGPKWLGLVLLFATRTGELLAILPDGELSRIRVGACNGLAAKSLARKDSSTLALLGSGFQAKSQLQAMCTVRPIQTVRVYSPNPDHRRQFVELMRPSIEAELVEADSAQEAVAGADIVAAASSALQPVMEAEWVEPGMHLSCIKVPEFSQAVLETCDLLFFSSKKILRTLNYHQKGLEDQLPELDWLTDSQVGRFKKEDVPDLGELVTGRVPGRTSSQQVTGFMNNVGQGLQFTLGGLVWERAEEMGLGQEVPADWFLQGKEHYGHGSFYYPEEETVSS